MTEKKQTAMSLNDRFRLLSASRTHDPALPPPTEERKPVRKLEGRRRLCKAVATADDENDDVPYFSGFSDFDSPSPQEPQKVNTKDTQEEVDVCSVQSERDGEYGNKAELSEPNFCIISDADSPTPVKKHNAKDGVRDTCNADSSAPKFSVRSDFDSHAPLKKDENDGGGNEIRDILNELSSKLEFLSIDRKKVPKDVIPMGDAFDLNEFKRPAKVADHLRNDGIVDVPIKVDDLASESGSSHYFAKESNFLNAGRNCVKTRPPIVKSEMSSLDESRGFITNPGNHAVSNPKKSAGKLARSSVIEIEEDDEEDCVVLSNNKLGKGAERRLGQKDEFNGRFKEKDVDSFRLSDPKHQFNLPGDVAKMLYPHQREGLKWLWTLHCQGKGGILGDDMGLGKTMQICGFLAGLFNSSLVKRVMVVAPKTLLPHWIKELTAVGLSGKIREYYGTCAKARQYELQYIFQDKGVLLTTYDIVRNNVKSLSGAHYFCNELDDIITWDYMILDEGHLIKNPGTQRAKSLLEIPSAHRIIISGTPIQNNLKELWALFNFCCPELLGDKTWFKDKYEYYILRGTDKNASDREKRIGSTVAKELREHIQPYFLRRLKSEVFNDDDSSNTAKLSKKNEMIVWLRLTGVQRRLYEAFLNTELVLSAFDGSPLAALTILKKICDHPLLLTRRAAEDVLEGMDSVLNQEDIGMAEKMAKHIADVTDIDDFQQKHDDVSCKISFILALLENLIPKGHHVLIFSQTRKMLNLIQESLTSKGYMFLRIDGTTKASDRLKIVNDFQEGVGAPIFLLTSQVGGLGLTLTKADRVIVVDPAWNPSTDNQSVDRAYRIGQNKDVIVYRLMTCGTVEEKIYRKQVYKGGLFKTATEHTEQIRYFSQQDLRELFSLPKHGFDVSLTQQQLLDEHDHQLQMGDSLEEHIGFLETLGIAGVSHHSLLFSKSAPTLPPAEEEDEEEVTRKRENVYIRNWHSSSSNEYKGDGAVAYAFNPKDLKAKKQSSPKDSEGKLTESDIKERMHRLNAIIADKYTMSKLPDKGEKLQKQIAELSSELDNIRLEKRSNF